MGWGRAIMGMGSMSMRFIILRGFMMRVSFSGFFFLVVIGYVAPFLGKGGGGVGPMCVQCWGGETFLGLI